MGARLSLDSDSHVDTAANDTSLKYSPDLFHVWLDDGPDSLPPEIINIQKQIQDSFKAKELHIFEDEIDCEGFIREQLLIDKVIIIVNVRMADFFVTRVHNLCQVACILIYCQTKESRVQHNLQDLSKCSRKVSHY